MQSCLICDDHALVRAGLTATIAAHWPTAALLEAGDYPAAWRLASQRPELCLVDLDMPGADPRAGVAQLHAVSPASRILIVTGSDDDDLLLDLLATGVAGFASKTSTSAILIAAIELILAGGRYLPPRLAELAVRSARPAPAVRAMPPMLSARQIEIAGFIAQGLSNKDIARQIGLSPSTVKTHVAGLIAVIGATNRTGAVTRARELGII